MKKLHQSILSPHNEDAYCHVLSIMLPFNNLLIRLCFLIISRKNSMKDLSLFHYCLSITENKYIRVFHVCMHGLWTRQMNFVKLQQNSFLHFVSLFPLILLHLHLLSSFILKLTVSDANQVSKPSQNQAMQSKAKIMLDDLSTNGKMWCCSFLMVCNCNTAWCLGITYEGGRG